MSESSYTATSSQQELTHNRDQQHPSVRAGIHPKPLHPSQILRKPDRFVKNLKEFRSQNLQFQQDMEGGKLSWERWGCSECWSRIFRASLCVPQLSQGYSSHLSTWYINTEYIERSLGHQPSRDQQELCTARVPWVLNAPMILCWPHTQRWISVL